MRQLLYYTCHTTETDRRLKDLWELFLGYELEHLRIAGEMLKALEGRDPEEIVGTTLPTPATFEDNHAYVTRVLKETADLRLVAGGRWARVSELPSDWPSYMYERVVNADGAPSETVVRLGMEAAGIDLVRAHQPQLLTQAGALRVDTLDREQAPNTVPARYQDLAPFRRDVQPGDTDGTRLLRAAERPTA